MADSDIQLGFDTGFAVAAIGGDARGARPVRRAIRFDRGGDLWRVGPVSDLDVVIEDDLVGIVNDLAL